jgi:hypothetical protein
VTRFTERLQVHLIEEQHFIAAMRPKVMHHRRHAQVITGDTLSTPAEWGGLEQSPPQRFPPA